MSELVVSSRDALAKALGVEQDDRGTNAPVFAGMILHPKQAEAIADHLLASGVVRVVPDEETLAGLVANERKLFEDAPRRASVFCDAHLYGFENGIRAALALFKGGEK